jgi:hypothetical protein
MIQCPPTSIRYVYRRPLALVTWSALEPVRNDPTVYRHWTFRCFRKSTQRKGPQMVDQHESMFEADFDQILADEAKTFRQWDDEAMSD